MSNMQIGHVLFLDFGMIGYKFGRRIARSFLKNFAEMEVINETDAARDLFGQQIRLLKHDLRFLNSQRIQVAH